MQLRFLLTLTALGVVSVVSTSCGGDDSDPGVCRVGAGARCGVGNPCASGSQCVFAADESDARCAAECAESADCASGEICQGGYETPNGQAVSVCVREVACSSLEGGFIGNGPGPTAAEACDDFCAIDQQCADQPSATCDTDCPASIEDASDSVSPECGEALTAFYACFGGSTCADIDAYLAGNPVGPADYPCKQEEVDFIAECNTTNPTISDTDIAGPCAELCTIDERCADSPNPSCVDECVADGEQLRLNVAAACFDAVASGYSCLGALSCSEIQEYRTGDPNGAADYPCKSADLAVAAACN